MAEPQPPTRHERSGPAPTRRERINYVKPGRVPGATRLEGATRIEQPTSAGLESALPPQLAPRLADVRWLARSGQSEPLSAVLVETGEQVFVKLYYEHSPPEQALLDMLRGADRERVTAVLDHGTFVDSRNGATRWWEMQPFHPGGTLADLLAAPDLRVTPQQRAADVLREITEALRYCHGTLDHAHRDVKPANILVRSSEPLGLVLADFGSARRQTISRHFSQSIRMTELYAAPEALNGHLGPEQDWWALGMVLLEVLLGAHPYVGLENHTVRDRLTNYDVDLSGVPDERWRLLLRGLLTRPREDRWGAGQITAWSRGESPTVAQPSGPAGVPPLDVDGTAVDDPFELALLFVNEPERGQDWLRREHCRLADWLAVDLGDTSWSVQPLRSPVTTDVVARRLMVSFVAQFGPSIIPPRFRSRHVDVRGLAALADGAASGGPRSEPGAIVAEILESRLIGIFARHHCTETHTGECGKGGCALLRSLARNPHLPTIRANAEGLLIPYTRATTRSGPATAGAPAADEAAHRAASLTLGYLLDPDRASRDAQALRRGGPGPDWWAALRDQGVRGAGALDGRVALAAATVLRDVADRQHRIEAERDRLAEQERADRDREARRAERAAAAGRRRAARHVQALRTHRTLTRWSAPVLSGAVFLGLLEALRMIDPVVHDQLYAQVLADPRFFFTRFYHYWYEVANRWLYRPPFGELAGPLTQRVAPWAQHTVLAVGIAALLALWLAGRLRRSGSLLGRGLFVAVTLAATALCFLLLPEVVGVVGAVAFGGAGIVVGLVVVGLVIAVMAAGS